MKMLRNNYPNKNTLVRIVSLCFLFLFTTVGYANERPDKCPSVNTIITEKFDVIVRSIGDSWIGIKNSRYDTNSMWHLSYFGITAKTEKEAREKIKKTLPSLHLEEGPGETNDGKWGCVYLGADETFAFATTPSESDQNLLFSQIKMKSAFKYNN